MVPVDWLGGWVRAKSSGSLSSLIGEANDFLILSLIQEKNCKESRWKSQRFLAHVILENKPAR